MSPVLKGLLITGVLLTTFVSGVLVGQLYPRPLERFLRFDAEVDPVEAERISAPVPDQIFTFYEELIPVGDTRQERPARSEQEVVGAREPSEAPSPRRIEREARDESSGDERPSGEDDSPPAPRTLAREPGAEGRVETPATEQGAQLAAPETRSLRREDVREASHAEPSADGSLVRDSAASPEEAAPPAVEGDAAEAGRLDAIAASDEPSERRLIRRAPAPVADAAASAPLTPLDREIGSTADWSRAQMVRAQLREEGVSVAVISVEEPGRGRRVALVLQGDNEQSLEELRARVRVLMAE